MSHRGDFDPSAVIYGKFTTYRPSTGATFTLAGTPALAVYKDNSTTQSTTGVTLTADFDSVTGLNHFAVDTSADGTFYSAGSFFDLVITTGTVDSVSVVGSQVASFTIRKDSSLKPTTAGRTLDVSSTGEAGLDWANVGSPTTTLALTGTTIAATQQVDLNTIKTQAVTAAAGVTFPSSIASPTNITAGTITTVTSVTNAPTTGDFTATMKTSIGTAVAASAVASVTGNVGGNVTGSVGSVTGLTASNLDATISSRASATNLATVAGYIDTEVADIKTVTDHLATALELDGGVYRFTTNALEQAPSGGATAADIADAVWDEALSGHATGGSAGATLSAAGSAGDPWSTALPGSYGSGTAGKIVGDNINATISSRAAASVLGAAVGASISADIAAVKTQTAAIETDTQDIQGRLPAALVSGRMDSSTGAMAANVMTAAAAASDLTTELQSGLATASVLTSVAGDVTAVKAKTDNLPASPAASGDIPSSASNAAAVLSATVEGSITLAQSMRLANAALGGKASGMATTEAVFRDLADTKDRLTATVDSDGNRTAITRDLT